MMKEIRRADHLESCLAEELALLYKHSPTCFASSTAQREVLSFLEEEPELPAYRVDVIADRPLSREIEARLGVRHESPQVIFVHRGRSVWTTSHYRIKADVLTATVREMRTLVREANPG